MQMIPTLTSSNQQATTMSSLEIAELTGKQHKHVMADIIKMLDQLGIQPAEFVAGYIDQQGKQRPCYTLPHREVKILITGYDVIRRAKVIDRLEELERKVALSLPQTFSEALQLAANQAKLLEEQAPMVELANAFIANGQDLSLTAAGKELGYGQREWFTFLRDRKLIIKRRYHISRNREAEYNEANSAMTTAGYMVTRHEPDLTGVMRPQTFVTPAGLDWLRKLVTSKKAA